jgi:hypothetical protein
VVAFNGLAQALEQVLPIEPHPPRCFWKEIRPALVELVKEEHRLMISTRDGGAPLIVDYLAHPNNSFGTGWSCGDQTAYLQNVKDEAQRAQPEMESKQ